MYDSFRGLILIPNFVAGGLVASIFARIIPFWWSMLLGLGVAIVLFGLFMLFAWFDSSLSDRRYLKEKEDIRIRLENYGVTQEDFEKVRRIRDYLVNHQGATTDVLIEKYVSNATTEPLSFDAKVELMTLAGYRTSSYRFGQSSDGGWNTIHQNKEIKRNWKIYQKQAEKSFQKTR
jgi:low affinity Fe/Cu permease